MPVTSSSSIYRDSVDSLKSSNSLNYTVSSRQYVDPWDLENYVYLRRHESQYVISTSKEVYSRTSCCRKKTGTDYCPSRYSQKELRKEPGYHTPALVEELHFGPPRHTNSSGSLYQPIFDDRDYQYAPLYQPLSDIDYQRLEDSRIMDLSEQRKISRTKISTSGFHPNRNCIYHGTSSNIQRKSVDEMFPIIPKDEGNCYIEVIRPSNFGLNSYGHLAIDYTNSWDSLNRKISK